MSNDVISKQGAFIEAEKVAVVRQVKASRTIAAILILVLLVPTVYLFPSLGLGGLNRPLHELADLFIVAIWIWIRISYGLYVQIRPRWFEAALWLLPITFVLSDLVYAVNGGSLGSKHLYEILHSLRPVAFVQLSMFILRLGKVELTRFGDVMRVLVNVISCGVIYIGLLAVLQMLGVRYALDFLYHFYRFQVAGLEDLAYDIVKNYGRATSIFHWANSLGAFLAVALMILFIYVLDHHNRRKLLLPIIAIIIGLFGIVLSGSRMAFIALVIGLFVTLILQRRFKVLIAVLVGGAIILYAMGFVEQKTGQASRFLELFNFVSGKGALPRNLENRFNNTSNVFSAFISSGASQWTGTTVTGYQSVITRSFDNEYLKYLVLNGYLGLVAFALFQAGVILRSWLAFRYFPPGTPGNTLSLALLAVSMSLVVSAYSQDAWGGERTLQLVFIVLGALVYFRNLRVENSVVIQAK